ncbi:MAG: hypothetical protein F6J97_26275 [Leptolyngbya sp. SIO4C1]|nr:hypothetical protein [Leptolyngbya sp. SIO4C1]
MSEFQHYEFQALDRALTKADQDYISRLSSRVRLSATSAEFVYNYGDFRGDPEQLLDRCFDMMVYRASFGVRRLMIRLPKTTPIEPYEPYCVDYLISLKRMAKSVILDINLSSETYYDWLSDESHLAGLTEIRADLLRGDLRSLYLAWLQSGFSESFGMDWQEVVEPPVPPNLKKLSPALKAFVELFEISDDLIAAAAEASDAQKLPKEPIADWVAALSEAERIKYLVRVAQGESHVGLELIQRLRAKFGQPVTAVQTAGRRTLAELVAAAQQKAEQRQRKVKLAAEKAEQKRLAALVPKVDNLWQSVEQLIERKQAKPYDEAVAQLKDLRAIAQQQGTLAAYNQRFQAIEPIVMRRPGLLRRMRAAGLLS